MGADGRWAGRQGVFFCVFSAGPLLRAKSEVESWKLEECRRGVGKLLWQADKPAKETHCRGQVKNNLGELSSSWDF